MTDLFSYSAYCSSYLHCDSDKRLLAYDELTALVTLLFSAALVNNFFINMSTTTRLTRLLLVACLLVGKYCVS